MEEPGTIAPKKPDVPVVWVLALALAICGMAFAARVTLVQPSVPDIVPKGLATLPFAAIFGLGLSVVITLAVANRHRWRAVLRPNPGRIIGALVLVFVTPIVVFDWVSWIVGPLVLFIVDGGRGWDEAVVFLMLLLGPLLLWYPVSCLIVSGITDRWVRVALYCLMFWTAYSAVILILGTREFRL